MQSVDEVQPVPFGSFLLLERLAIGGMAEVFLARNTKDDRLCAVKRILPTIAADDEFIAMFIDEAKIAGQLNHQNIAQIIEIGRIDDSYFIAMEYVSGHDVRALWDRVREAPAGAARGLPIGLSCHVVRELAEGLDYAHKRKDVRGRPLGIIHRDVSPQNILISYDGDLKIIDFGIAKAADRLVKTQTGILKGKFAYMAPEQARGELIDHRSDVFAIGVVLYELLTGERAFKGDTDFALLEKVRRVDVTPVRQLRPEVPRELERIVMKALARDASDRYAWASVLADDLDRFLGEHRITATRDEAGAFVRRMFREEHTDEHRRLQALRKHAGAAAPEAARSDPGRVSASNRAARLPRLEASFVDGSTDVGDPLPTPSDDDLDGVTAVASPTAPSVENAVVTAPRRGGRPPEERAVDRVDRAPASRPGRPGHASGEGRAVEARGEVSGREGAARPGGSARTAPRTATVATASDMRGPATTDAAAAFDPQDSLGGTGAAGATLPSAPKLRPRPGPASSPSTAPPPLLPTELPQPAAPSTGPIVAAGLVGALIGAGLAFAVAVAMRTLPPDTIIVTEPRLAEVLRGDSVLCARTPCAVRLGKGTHRLRLRSAGLAPVDRVVDVGVGAAVVDVVLDQPARVVQVETNPPGAVVELDGAVVDGATPLTLSPQPLGRMLRLRLVRDGFEPLFVQREVTADATWRFDLPTSTTAWTVTTKPDDAVIGGAGRDVTGTTTLTVGRRPVTLKVQRPGCPPVPTTLQATGVAAAERVVELSCPPLDGRIAIEAPRRPIAVRIDGVSVGKATPLNGYPMPAGVWEVSIVTPRGRRETRSVEVRAGDVGRFVSKAK
ncbi:MAG: PEGA domain-containing protein [Deltaproteobacteria bacterium]|nr:PEGA domain-containing protein [Deltaproteobacteria bacterium]